MSYTLGIDIGIASVGFAGIAADKTILSAGVHIFEAAENPKDGASLALPRREKRGLRRVLRRKAQRKYRLRQLFSEYGFGSTAFLNTPPVPAANDDAPLSPWECRKYALQRLLTEEELIRSLYHIGIRRGFQSNRKTTPSDVTEEQSAKETKKALAGAEELQRRMQEAGTATVGAFLADQPKKRNGDGSYENFVTRGLLKDEVTAIFEAQQRFGNKKATDAFREAYEAIAFFQNPLQSSENMVGSCALDATQKRAPKCAYSAELFVAWSRLNNTRLYAKGGTEIPLTADQKCRLIEKAHTLKSFSYKQARSELQLPEDARFNIGYRKTKEQDNSWEAIRDSAEKASFLSFKGYHTLKAALDIGSVMDWQKWLTTDRDRLDDIARILSFYEDTDQIHALLAVHGIDSAITTRLTAITSFSKTLDLSLKTIRALLPYMEQGMTYDKACTAAGYAFSKKDNKGLEKVPPFEDVRNPVVNRALAQTRKVINAMIRKYGMPDTIIVELARDVGKSFKDRKDIEREQKKNEAFREEAKQHAAEILGVSADSVHGGDILKYRLWKEQEGICPYSGVYMTPDMLRDSLATQIDHVIPYQRSWDDSYLNKVLCLTGENQAKGNRTPFEYLAASGMWDAVCANSARLPRKKAERLLMQQFDERKEDEWKKRALNDTRYMARLLKNHLEVSLGLGEGNRVQTRNGRLTAHLRGNWGFPDKNRRNDRHHALDAIVLACSTQSMVQQFTNWNKYEARKQNPAEKPRPPLPWPNFRDDALKAINTIFVSRMPVRKVTGSAHEETIRSIRQDNEGKRQIIQRKKLTSLSAGDLENLVDKERNIRLYQTLKARLDEYGGKADKAFAAATPIYMPVNDPSRQAPPIHSVNIITKEKSGIEINKGLASNGDMVRVDVYRANGKFQLVPVYVHHFASERLPNKTIVAFKDESEWLEMRDEDFLFSLHKNELVRITTKKETFEGYFKGVDRSTGAIEIIQHDRGNFIIETKINAKGIATKTVKNPWRGIGIKSALTFEKYAVDYFGNKSLIKKEKRGVMAYSDDPESHETDPVERADSAA